jgi:hypothetical protein
MANGERPTRDSSISITFPTAGMNSLPGFDAEGTYSLSGKRDGTIYQIVCRLTVNSQAQPDQLATMDPNGAAETWSTGYSVTVPTATSAGQTVPATLAAVLQQSINNGQNWTDLKSTSLSFNVLCPVQQQSNTNPPS